MIEYIEFWFCLMICLLFDRWKKIFFFFFKGEGGGVKVIFCIIKGCLNINVYLKREGVVSKILSEYNKLFIYVCVYIKSICIVFKSCVDVNLYLCNYRR